MQYICPRTIGFRYTFKKKRNDNLPLTNEMLFAAPKLENHHCYSVSKIGK